MNLQFLNVYQNKSKTNLSENTTPQNNSANMFIMSRRFVNTRAIPTPQVQQPTPVPEEPKKKMVWGPPIWFLFHTMAEKIKEESFQSLRFDILNKIYLIANNLPCPICSTHAKEYLDRINFNAIQSKNDLKNMLFHFHNEVNKRKAYSLFAFEDLDEKYSKAVTVNIIQNFMFHFQDKQRSPKLIASDLQRTHIARALIEWFQKNIGHFHP
jgi:hypothetical protein